MSDTIKVPIVCSVCGKPIPAGGGVFYGPGTSYAHSGLCAHSVGAFPGGPVTWGELPELISKMIATDGITFAEAAEAARWREPEGEGAKG